MSAELQSLLQDSDLCGEGGEQVLIDVDFDYGEVTVTVKDVPALRCPNFDDDLIPGPIGVLISELANAIARESLASLRSHATLGDSPLEAVIRMPRGFQDSIPA